MPGERSYLDTSALAKWYINESGSEAFVDFIRGYGRAVISRLGVVELRCLLARRRWAGDFTRRYERQALATFEDDISAGDLEVAPLADVHALGAYRLVESLGDQPLRTLDAIHLAVVQSLALRLAATADQQLASAAQALGFEVVVFG